jgi:DNA modification methylase
MRPMVSCWAMTQRRLEYMPLDELKGAPRNPKRHSSDIPVSIGRFGYTEPIVLDERTGRMVAGHGRRTALMQMRAAKQEPPEGVQVHESGQWLVPVLRGWSSRSDTEADAYLLASNRLTEAGGWENAELDKLLLELHEQDALHGLGFDSDYLTQLLADAGQPVSEPEPETEEDDTGLEEEDRIPEPPAEPWVKRGDVFSLGQHRLMCGDSLTQLDLLLGGELVAAVCTDPPYEIGFMGKTWDDSGIAFNGKLWQRILERAKPGAHLLAFGATRTYHRMAVSIEDAGWEIRDSIHWLYGTGFPKSLDVSKALDKEAGAEREVVGTQEKPRGQLAAMSDRVGTKDYWTGIKYGGPVTEAAKQWAGFGTALKPGHEPAVLARKPLDGTVAENVTKHGAGALNIDGCRIETDETLTGSRNPRSNTGQIYGIDKGGTYTQNPLGRWPANVVLDPDAAAELDEQSGVSTSPPVGSVAVKKALTDQRSKGNERARISPNGHGDSGGASRFFYVAKPSRAERGSTNTHATVKPLALMRHLVQLIGPPGGIVLEPFAGSGTTLLACEQLGLPCRAMELDPGHVQIALERWEKLTGGKAKMVEP